MKKSVSEREHEHILQTYGRLPIEVDFAEGARIYDNKGNIYLDFLGGIAVNTLGHSHPRILEALARQSAKYLHVSNYFYQKPQVDLAEKLKDISGFDRVFYTNSGTEAIEGAIKLVRRWGNSQGRKDIISFSGAFHGRSYGALSIMDKPHYKDGMGPFLEGTKVLPYNDSETLKSMLNSRTSAVFLEFLQGEGGIIAAGPGFVKTLVSLQKEYGFLIVADEIQSGVGRTGRFFGFDHYDIKPDIVTMAKGMGGGLPLGAILTRESLAKVWEKGMHGTTYGGNALACATGMVVINELQSSVLDNVVRTGEYLHGRLEEVKKDFPSRILEVRGMGLMKGLLLNTEAAPLVSALLERKVITNAASGNVLRLIPPLIIGREEVDEFIKALRDALASE